MWMNEKNRNKFSFIPEINTYHWLRFILISKPRSLHCMENPIRDSFCLILKCHCFSFRHLKKKIMLLCCKSGSVTGQPLPVFLSKCPLLHFEASLEPYTALTIQATLRGAKSFVWSKLLCFCFLLLFLVHAVLNRESFPSGGHWEEINSHTHWESLSQVAGEITEAEC